MNLNVDKHEIRIEFKQKLHWFEEEFDLIFKNKTHYYTDDEIQLANQLLDKLSETINEYRDEKLLYPLISTLNNIERNYPGLFNSDND
jgi:hypothetical protein